MYIFINIILLVRIFYWHLFCRNKNKQKEQNWANTPPPLYSPATMPPFVRPARQGLPSEAGYPSHRPTFSIHKKSPLPKTDRQSGIEAESSSNLDAVGSSYRLKVEEYDDEDNEYYDDFEVVEKGKRRSDGYGEGNFINVLGSIS